MVKIRYIEAYATDKLYGKALNKHIADLPDDCWIVIRDGDTMFLTPDYGQIIEQAIIDNPTAHLMTCATNRSYGQLLDPDPNILNHYEKSRNREKKYTRITTVAPAHLWIMPKSTWRYNPFDEYPIIHCFNSFDTRFCRGLRGPVIKIEHLYIFHFYRLNKNVKDFAHLI